jgi:hypothetical protein
MTATRRAAPRPCPGVCHVCPRVCHNVCHNVCALHACLVCESVSCVRVSSSAYMCVSPPYPCVCLLPSSPPRCFSWRAHVIHVPSSHTLTHRHTDTHRHDDDTTHARRPHKQTRTHTRAHTHTHEDTNGPRGDNLRRSGAGGPRRQTAGSVVPRTSPALLSASLCLCMCRYT